MRWIFVCALIVAQAPAEEPRLVPSTRVIRLSTPNHFRARCGPGNDTVNACTQFVGPKLATRCTQTSGLWSIRPTATYTALIYLFQMDYFHHEQLHGRDMQRAVDSYLRSLETRTFATARECEGSAQKESEGFASVMREFARQSNLQRGCTRLAAK